MLPWPGGKPMGAGPGKARRERVFEKGLLAGKRVLVTGGGTGLGKAIGRRYLELGAELVICGRRTEVLAATAQELERDLGARIETHACDVRSADAVEEMI